MKDSSSVQEPDTGDIYTIRVDGTDLRQLTDEGLDEYPAWSPDGKTIAFDRLTKANGGNYTVNSDGGGLRKLTDPPQGLVGYSTLLVSGWHRDRLHESNCAEG